MTLHGNLLGLDPAARSVTVQDADGTTHAEPYDVLVIATGVTNGFWRRPEVQSPAEVEAELHSAHERLGSAGTIARAEWAGCAAAVTKPCFLQWFLHVRFATLQRNRGSRPQML